VLRLRVSDGAGLPFCAVVFFGGAKGKGSMTSKWMVVGETPNSYEGKKGHVDETILTLMDWDDSKKRLKHSVEYAMRGAERTEHSGKLAEKVITMEVFKFRTWRNAIQIEEGRIVGLAK